MAASGVEGEGSAGDERAQAARLDALRWARRGVEPGEFLQPAGVPLEARDFKLLVTHGSRQVAATLARLPDESRGAPVKDESDEGVHFWFLSCWVLG
jgi:hypothetical protein